MFTWIKQTNKPAKNFIYNWYVDKDFFLLKFMVDRGTFREDIYIFCTSFKNKNNSLVKIYEEYEKKDEKRYKIMVKLKDIDKNIKKMQLLKMNEYYHSNIVKYQKKIDPKKINQIKKYVFELYQKFGEENER